MPTVKIRFKEIKTVEVEREIVFTTTEQEQYMLKGIENREHKHKDLIESFVLEAYEDPTRILSDIKDRETEDPLTTLTDFAVYTQFEEFPSEDEDPNYEDYLDERYEELAYRDEM